MGSIANRCFSVLVFLFPLFPLLAQEVEARWIVEEEGNNPELNTYLHLEKVRLEISQPTDKMIVWPQFKDSLGGFEILEAGSIDTLSEEGSRLKRSQTFLLMAMGQGRLPLPPIPIKGLEEEGERKYQVEGAFVDVATTRLDSTAEVKPLKDIQPVPYTWREWLPWVLISLAILALIGEGIWYYRKRKSGEDLIPRQVPQIPAHEVAMRRLSQLEAKKRWQQGHVKEYYSKLTEILREYIEERYMIPAMESISDDIVRDLRQESLKGNFIEGISTLLSRADLAKFAKSQPTAGENLDSMEFARSFIKESQQLTTRWEEEARRLEAEGKEEAAL